MIDRSTTLETPMTQTSLEELLGAATDLTPEQERIRACFVDVFRDRSDTDTIRIAGDLIEYVRAMMSVLAATRRNAAISARTYMSPDEIAQATGLSKATISRLITEHRIYS